MRRIRSTDHVDPPHLHGFYESPRGEFALEAIGPRLTRLTRRTWYSQRLQPSFYWSLLCELGISQIHRTVLEHVRDMAEARSGPESAHDDEKPTVKAEETRERILDSALKLFRDKGFDDTTMRDIAAEAGVATGAAYYYFRSKEELVMAFYVRTADEARELWPDVIGTGRDLRKRLRAIIDLKFDQFAKHRRLLVALVRIGIDPAHPLSPFGKETEPMRERASTRSAWRSPIRRRAFRRTSRPICRACCGSTRWD